MPDSPERLPFPAPEFDDPVWQLARVNPPSDSDFPIFIDACDYAKQVGLGSHHVTFAADHDHPSLPWSFGTRWCRARPPAESCSGCAREQLAALQRKIARQAESLRLLHKELAEAREQIRDARAALQPRG